MKGHSVGVAWQGETTPLHILVFLQGKAALSLKAIHSKEASDDHHINIDRVRWAIPNY